MNLPLQVLAKDLRRYWPLAVLATVFIGFEALGPLWGLNFTTGNNTFDQLFRGFGKWPVVFILVVAVMQEDLTVGDKAFWRTRPIGPGALLAGKLLFFGLALGVPAVLTNLWLAHALATPAAVSIGIAIETTGFMLLAVLGAALIASTTRSLVHAGVAALGVLLVCVAIVLMVDTLPSSIQFGFLWQQNMPMPAAQLAIASVCAGAALIGLLAHQFLTMRTGRTVALLVAAVLAVRLVVNSWTWDFITPPALPEAGSAPIAASEGLVLEVEPHARIRGTRWIWDTTLRRDRPETVVALSVSLGGVPPGRMFTLGAVTPTLTLRGEPEAVSSGLWQYSSWWSRTLREAAVRRALGFEFSAEGKTEATGSMVGVFSLPEKRLTALGGARGHLTLKFNLSERALHEEVRLPLRAGATWRRDGEMWRIDAAGLDDEAGLTLTLSYLRATSMFAPYGSAKPDLGSGMPGRGFVVLNRSRGEYAMASSTGDRELAGVVAGGTRTFKVVDFHRAGRAVTAARPDNAWLAEAELVILESKPVAEIPKVVELANFVMPRPDERFDDYW